MVRVINVACQRALAMANEPIITREHVCHLSLGCLLVGPIRPTAPSLAGGWVDQMFVIINKLVNFKQCTCPNVLAKALSHQQTNLAPPKDMFAGPPFGDLVVYGC